MSLIVSASVGGSERSQSKKSVSGPIGKLCVFISFSGGGSTTRSRFLFMQMHEPLLFYARERPLTGSRHCFAKLQLALECWRSITVKMPPFPFFFAFLFYHQLNVGRENAC